MKPPVATLRIINISWRRPFRLRTRSGGYTFLWWSDDYGGPELTRDREGDRVIEKWWEDPELCEALDWFIDRGRRT